MNRRGFLTALGALATTAALPSVPSIPLSKDVVISVYKIMLNSMYGKMYQGGRVVYASHDGVITTDIRSAYPSVYQRIKSLEDSTDQEVYEAFQS